MVASADFPQRYAGEKGLSNKNHKDGEPRKSGFTDETTRAMVTPGAWNEYGLSYADQVKFYEYAHDFADNLSRLHGLKPLDRKVWRKHKFTGMGELDVFSMLEEWIRTGGTPLMERRRVRLNPDRPSVGLALDISASMTHTRVVRAGMLLATTFIELFGRGFALDFTLGTIGTSPIFFKPNIEFEAAKRWVLARSFNQLGTEFTWAINAFERSGFFERRNTKFLFIITDGHPEYYAAKGIEFNPGFTPNEPQDEEETRNGIEQMIYAMRERWGGDRRISYFWLQLGGLDSMLDWVSSEGYLPPREECKKYSDAEYNEAQQNVGSSSTPNLSNIYVRYAKFMWEQHIAQNVCYMSLKKMLTGEAFHDMMDYLVAKFNRTLKL